MSIAFTAGCIARGSQDIRRCAPVNSFGKQNTFEQQMAQETATPNLHRIDAADIPSLKADMDLPAEPLTKIRARRAFALTNLREIWQNSELLSFLVCRDLNTRYKQTSI